jgi:hypothetical protein
MTAAASSPRTASGRFAAGLSGNPAGRPKGSRSRATLLAEAIDDDEAAALLRKLVELALAGDRASLRFLVSRLFPVPRGRAVELELAPGAERDSEAVIAATLRAVADGEVTPDEAATIGRLLGQSARATATTRPSAAAPRRREAAPATSPAAALPPTALRPPAPPVSGLFSGVSAAALLAAQGGVAAGPRLNRAA